MSAERSVVHPHGYPQYAWNPWHRPTIQHVALGADRYVENAEPPPPRQPVGFVLPPVEREPLLWEGDGS